MATVGSVFDLARDPHPILLKGIVALDDGLEFEPTSRVSDLFTPQDINTTIDVFLCDRRRDLFDAHEVLLVECTKTLDSQFEFINGNVELGSFHGFTLLGG